MRMQSRVTNRGFVIVEHPTYANEPVYERLIQESSAISEETMNRHFRHYLAKPGASFLWIGADHHLDRKEVRQLIRRMKRWLRTGRLKVDEPTETGGEG